MGAKCYRKTLVKESFFDTRFKDVLLSLPFSVCIISFFLLTFYKLAFHTKNMRVQIRKPRHNPYCHPKLSLERYLHFSIISDTEAKGVRSSIFKLSFLHFVVLSLLKPTEFCCTLLHPQRTNTRNLSLCFSNQIQFLVFLKNVYEYSPLLVFTNSFALHPC